ncbi:chromate efflux transporter [Halomonas sp. 18H]|uniref:chromate efflux transporter n=1 Tax=Halomonas almeriensis TaxID=308163 RepID=UPI002232287B|nr:MULTISPECIES: chromate efflux transporter [Halomonas]MCW4152798.1 chromate efflux transporter [Halomonas sp. 18H]MDN3552003.1 chromate efflux transporter [Halomonas almeriensis]
MTSSPESRPVREVFHAFLLLGMTAFGGPVAHLAYFRETFVTRRQWLDEHAYADLVALCQFLPGPASSQVGFALGMMRAGPLGGLAAWTAFTLPSALLLVLFALGAGSLDGAVGQGLLQGLKVVAVAIVAHAVWGMARNLCPDGTRAAIAVAATLLVTALGGTVGQVVTIVLGGLAGLLFCRGSTEARPPVPGIGISRRGGLFCLGLFLALLLGLPMLAAPGSGLALLDAFYRAGALVFGGGHVVLPLLEAAVVQPGWVGADDFLAGYGAAQAVPGPLFTFSAYLGMAATTVPGGLVGAGMALLAIFLPGMLLLMAALPFWNSLRERTTIQALMRGANAAVVGLLVATLYQPVWTSAILGPREFALALVGFTLLAVWRQPAWMAVLVCGLGGMALNLIPA